MKTAIAAVVARLWAAKAKAHGQEMTLIEAVLIPSRQKAAAKGRVKGVPFATEIQFRTPFPVVEIVRTLVAE